MGNYQSSAILSDKDRESVDTDLERLQNNVWLTYKTHFTSSEYYGRWAKWLDVAVNVIGPCAAGGFVFTLNGKKSRLAAAGSLVGIVFSGLQKYESNNSKFHPAKKQELHFKAGIELQGLHSELIAYRKLLLKDPSLTREKYREEYKKIIQTKCRCDSIIQTEHWAYLRSRKLIKEIEQREKEP